MKKPRASPNTWGSISTTSVIGVLVNFMLPNTSKLRMLVDDAQQILAVTAFFQRLGQLHQLIGVDETRAPGDLFNAGHFQSLSFLDDADERAGIEQGIVSAGIKPGRTPAQTFDVQITDLEVRAIQVSDLEFAARRWSQSPSKGRGAPVVKINSGDRIIRRRRL